MEVTGHFDVYWLSVRTHTLTHTYIQYRVRLVLLTLVYKLSDINRVLSIVKETHINYRVLCPWLLRTGSRQCSFLSMDALSWCDKKLVFKYRFHMKENNKAWLMHRGSWFCDITYLITTLPSYIIQSLLSLLALLHLIVFLIVYRIRT